MIDSQVLIWVSCRDYEPYLAECLLSAHQQTHPCAVFVSHDGCGGGNPAGVAANRNRLLRAYPALAGAFHYVVFLDADDLLPPDYIERLADVAAGSHAVVASDATLFGDRPGLIRVKDPITLDTLLEVNTVHCAALVSLRALSRCGGFDPTLPAYEDWELWCRMAAMGVEFRSCHSTSLLYRQHPGSRHRAKTADFGAMQRWLKEKYR